MRSAALVLIAAVFAQSGPAVALTKVCAGSAPVIQLENVLKKPALWCASVIKNDVTTTFENLKPSAINRACSCILSFPPKASPATVTVAAVDMRVMTQTVKLSTTITKACKNGDGGSSMPTMSAANHSVPAVMASSVDAGIPVMATAKLF